MASYKIALFGSSNPEVLAVVRAHLPEGFELVVTQSCEAEERLRAVRGADFFMVGPTALSAGEIAAAPGLRLIQKWGAGVDDIALDAAADRGIPVAITAGGNATAVAEMTVALMLAVYRHLPYMDRRLRQGRWVATEMRSVSYQISGKTVGLVGIGSIGREVARRVRAFDAEVIYYNRTGPNPEMEARLGVQYRALDELLSQSDIVSLHVPLRPETRNLLDARALALMKRTAILINTARGAVVDEAALIEALSSGRLAGAGLDTFAREPLEAGHPLCAMDNVVLSPHVAGGVLDNVASMATHCFDNMLRVLRGEPLPLADLIVPPRPK